MFFKDNPQLIIISADKSNTTTTTNKTLYYKKANNLLKDTGIYQTLDKDITKTIH